MCICMRILFNFLYVSTNTFVHRSPESIPSAAVVVVIIVDELWILSLSLSLSLPLSLALPTCCFTYKRKKSRLTPWGYSHGRQYDVSSLVTIRRRQTDSYREEKEKQLLAQCALLFLLEILRRFSSTKFLFKATRTKPREKRQQDAQHRKD